VTTILSQGIILKYSEKENKWNHPVSYTLSAQCNRTMYITLMIKGKHINFCATEFFFFNDLKVVFVNLTSSRSRNGIKVMFTLMTCMDNPLSCTYFTTEKSTIHHFVSIFIKTKWSIEIKFLNYNTIADVFANLDSYNLPWVLLIGACMKHFIFSHRIRKSYEVNSTIHERFTAKIQPAELRTYMWYCSTSRHFKEILGKLNWQAANNSANETNIQHDWQGEIKPSHGNLTTDFTFGKFDGQFPLNLNAWLSDRWMLYRGSKKHHPASKRLILCHTCGK
jgi:hypothetical protein